MGRVRSIILVLAIIVPSICQAEDYLCLAENMYYEAEGESYIGRVAVARVVLNRVKSEYYPNDICGVVYQHKQFSWTLQEDKFVSNKQAWREILYLSRDIINRRNNTLINFQATHFHNHTVNPYWVRGKRKLVKYGNHTFYKGKQ